jgi:transposase-like protein
MRSLILQVSALLFRRVKYLNNIIEQEHRYIKKRVRACLGYHSFDTAERTIQGVEAVNMMRKG